MNPVTVEIKLLDAGFADVLSAELAKESKEYLKYFTPFEFSGASLKKILSESKKDKYFGIFVGNALVGFYMLRGFDAGFDVPSYGVWISSKYENKGLSTLTLYHAFAYCKINNISTLMLKVHPDNTTAKRLYEKLGFKQTGFDERNKNLIYHKSFLPEK